MKKSVSVFFPPFFFPDLVAMCTQRRKYLWRAANDCEETREKVREKETQMNFKVNFPREGFFFYPSQYSCVLFLCVCKSRDTIDAVYVRMFVTPRHTASAMCVSAYVWPCDTPGGERVPVSCRGNWCLPGRLLCTHTHAQTHTHMHAQNGLDDINYRRKWHN